MRRLSLLVLVCLYTTNVYAVKLKFAVLTPKENSWGKALVKMTKEIKKATDGEVKFKIYYGGVKGDEPVVKRLVHTEMLDGGIFTGKTLGEINGDVRVMELPFTFYHDRKKALETLNKLAPFFNKGFEKQKFVNLGFFELGNVYFVSQKKTENIESLKGLKIWSWPGDDLVDAMIKEMDLISVPAPLPDVLSSLSTGIIEAAYAPPLGIVALQWNTKVKYLVNFPISYSTGAFLMTENAWKKIPEKYRNVVKKIANKYISEVNIANLDDNNTAMNEMKKSGVEFIKFSDDDIKKAETYRAKIIKRLITSGSLFSKDALSKLEGELGKKL
jgi:TRAP-type transport system periplasmic protein